MAIQDFLQLVVHQATSNGFDFPRWYESWLGCPWTTEAEAFDRLAQNRGYYALIFSHDFAQSFWKQGSRITFMVPSSSYTRRDKDGTLVEVQRKAYTRRRLKPDAWLYHLREMSNAEEPLRYIRRYLLVLPDADAKDPARRRESSSAGGED
jgi:hypothetical protein